MHNNTLILPIVWYFEGMTWSDFNEISLETPLSCMENWWKFWCIFPKFQKIPG